MQENNRTEFKSELNDRLERAVVSFLNYAGGGEIIIGIDNDGKVIGVKEPDLTQRKIVDRIRNNIKPQTLGLFDVVQDKMAVYAGTDKVDLLETREYGNRHCP